MFSHLNREEAKEFFKALPAEVQEEIYTRVLQGCMKALQTNDLNDINRIIDVADHLGLDRSLVGVACPSKRMFTALYKAVINRQKEIKKQLEYQEKIIQKGPVTFSDIAWPVTLTIAVFSMIIFLLYRSLRCQD